MMQSLFLDVTKEQLEHNIALQSCTSLEEHRQTIQGKYIRIHLRESVLEDLQQTLIQVIIEECVHWIMQCNRHRFLIQDGLDVMILEKRVQERVILMQPQLEALICHDIDCYRNYHTDFALFSWNLEGYLRFSAKKLKWTIETILQEEYQICKDERDREEFIALLQFCVAVQPCLLDDVYITLGSNQFTMVDIWGNDLQQIYLDALPKEEYLNVQMHDLLLSILMTMLPKNIHLFVETEQMKVEQREEQKNLINLLQQIFADRLLIESSV